MKPKDRPSSIPRQTSGVDSLEKRRDEAWAPRLIAVSGPAYLKLSPEERLDVQRLHQNLGHLNPDLFHKILKERGATKAVLSGVRSKKLQCPTCAENQTTPLLSRPGSIHRVRDFNDEVGGNGAWWENGRVEVRVFTSCILWMKGRDTVSFRSTQRSNNPRTNLSV